MISDASLYDLYVLGGDLAILAYSFSAPMLDCWYLGYAMSSRTYFFGNEGTSFELRTVRISGFEDHKFTDLVDLPVLRLPDLSEKCGFQAANFNC